MWGVRIHFKGKGGWMALFTDGLAVFTWRIALKRLNSTLESCPTCKNSLRSWLSFGTRNGPPTVVWLVMVISEGLCHVYSSSFNFQKCDIQIALVSSTDLLTDELSHRWGNEKSLGICKPDNRPTFWVLVVKQIGQNFAQQSALHLKPRKL